MAQTLTTRGSYLAEQLHHLGTVQGSEGYLVLEGSNIQHVTVGYHTLRQVGTHATCIVHGEVRLLAIVLGSPYQDVRQQVRQLTLRTLRCHISGRTSHYRSHDAVHHVLIRFQKLGSLSIRIRIIATVYHNTSPLNACHLIVRTARNNGQHNRHQRNYCCFPIHNS